MCESTETVVVAYAWSCKGTRRTRKFIQNVRQLSTWVRHLYILDFVVHGTTEGALGRLQDAGTELAISEKRYDLDYAMLCL